MSEKVRYTAVPLEDPQVPNERELPPYSEKPRYTGAQTIFIDSKSHGCCHQNCQRKKAWKKALFAVLVLFLGGRFLLAGLSFFMFNDFNNSDDQYIWIQVPGMGPHNEPEIGSHEMPYNAPQPPEVPKCEPTIKWNGPSELLLNPQDVTGLIFSIKGMSAFGSVTIQQNPHANKQDFINVTSKIYLSEDSLQKQVDIKIDIIDEDYSITVEAPSFDGPRPTQKCVQVDTIITIPNNTHFFRSLLVDVPNSWISVEGLGAVDFAYVSLKTRNGHIHAKDLSAAIAEVATVNGHVHGGYVVSESLDVRTANGAIGIDAIVNPWSDEVSITTKSINGHLDIAVHDLSEKQVLNFKAASVNGGIVATVPDSYHGDFSVSTFVGYTYVEGKDITYIKKTRNAKIGSKNKKSEDDDDRSFSSKKKMKHMHKKTRKCHHGHHDKNTSRIIAEAVTGAAELYFLK